MKKKNGKFLLNRTLKRKVEFLPLEEEHLRFIWGAYKMGALGDLSSEFLEDATEKTVPEFREAFGAHVHRFYDEAWVFYAVSKRGVKEPVGYVAVTTTSVPSPVFVADMIWFPWASTRNKIECAVNWFNEMRKVANVTEYARHADKAFFLHICKHGIMRRVGTKRGVYDGEDACEFETVEVS